MHFRSCQLDVSYLCEISTLASLIVRDSTHTQHTAFGLGHRALKKKIASPFRTLLDHDIEYFQSFYLKIQCSQLSLLLYVYETNVSYVRIYG